MSAKLLGALKKLQNYTILRKCVLYKEILEILSTLSLHFEKENIYVSEVYPQLEITCERLQDLLTRPSDLSFFKFDQSKGELSFNVPKTGHNRRNVENRVFTEISYNKMSQNGSDIDEIEASIKTLKAVTIEKPSNCLLRRFESFKSDIY